MKSAGLQKGWQSWAHDYAIIRLHTAFERLVTEALVGAVNNDTRTISERIGVSFPKHLTDEVCDYMITGGGFLDIRGRAGLIQILKEFVPDTHYLVSVASRPDPNHSLDRLTALRNFAAHRSKVAKRAARKAVGVRLSSAGAWLRRPGRFDLIAVYLEQLSDSVRAGAPY